MARRSGIACLIGLLRQVLVFRDRDRSAVVCTDLIRMIPNRSVLISFKVFRVLVTSLY